MTTAFKTTASHQDARTVPADARRAPMGAPRPAAWRLWAVELRKLVDTRAGLALFIVAALLAGAFGGGAMLIREGQTFGDVARTAAVPAALLASVMAILLVTSETSQRTALTTFALTPRRGRVLAAKVLAVATLGLAVTALSLLAAALIVPVGAAITGAPIVWDVDWADLGLFTVGTLLSCLSAMALALALGNAPAAIVIVLAWPMLVGFLSVVPGASEALSWIDIAVVADLADGATPTAIAQVLTGAAAWILLPGALGLARLLRGEIR